MRSGLDGLRSSTKAKWNLPIGANATMEKPKYKIECNMNGSWAVVDYAKDIEEAVMLASSHCKSSPEDKIRIKENKEE